MSAKSTGAPRNNFPRPISVSERMLMLENDHSLLTASVSELASSIDVANRRMDAVNEWQTKMLVSEATRIEQQKATDLVIANLTAQLNRWNNNFSRVTWIAITPLIASIPLGIGMVYLFVYLFVRK